MAGQRCTANKADGTPCGSFAASRSGLCVTHDPERRESQLAASRRGGEARANARRAARQWASIGEQISSDDLPAILKSCMLSVRAGAMEPGQASAIMGLAKTAVSLSHDLELEARIAALESAAGMDSTPANVRRIA